MKTAKYPIFLSHVHEDERLASGLTDLIKTSLLNTQNVFQSSDKKVLMPGDIWLQKLSEALNYSSVFLCVCTKLSITRPWIHFEAGVGYARNCRVIPLLFDELPVRSIPATLSVFQALTIRNDENVYTLIETLAEHFEMDPPDKKNVSLTLESKSGKESLKWRPHH